MFFVRSLCVFVCMLSFSLLAGCMSNSTNVDDFIADNTMVEPVASEMSNSDPVQPSSITSFSQIDSEAIVSVNDSGKDAPHANNDTLTIAGNNRVREFPVLVDMEREVLASLLASDLRIILYFWDENHVIDQDFIVSLEQSMESDLVPVDVVFVRSDWESDLAQNYQVRQPNTFVLIDSQGIQLHRMAKGVVRLERLLEGLNI